MTSVTGIAHTYLVLFTKTTCTFHITCFVFSVMRSDSLPSFAANVTCLVYYYTRNKDTSTI